MAKLFPWDPWLELETLKEDLKRLAEDAACPSPFASSFRKVAQFRPVADVIETEDGFVILVELPGLAREDILLEALDNAIAVYGERPVLGELAKAAFHVMERSYGCFARRFTFEKIIDPQGVKARMKGGLLQIYAPKCRSTAITRHMSIEVEA